MYLEYHTVVVLCSFFWFWREIVFDVTYVLSVQYSCAVVLVFLLWQEQPEKKRYSRLSGGCAINYDRKKKDTVVCLASCAVCCISFWF